MITAKVRVITDDRDYKDLYRMERSRRRFVEDMNGVLLFIVIVMTAALIWIAQRGGL